MLLYLKINHDLYSHSTLIAWNCYFLLTNSFILKNSCQIILIESNSSLLACTSFLTVHRFSMTIRSLWAAAKPSTYASSAFLCFVPLSRNCWLQHKPKSLLKKRTGVLFTKFFGLCSPNPYVGKYCCGHKVLSICTGLPKMHTACLDGLVMNIV